MITSYRINLRLTISAAVLIVALLFSGTLRYENNLAKHHLIPTAQLTAE